MKKRKVFTLVMTGLLAFSLISCGGASSRDSSYFEDSEGKKSVGTTVANLNSQNEGFIAKKGDYVYFNRTKEGNIGLCRSKTDNTEYEVLIENEYVDLINVLDDKMYYRTAIADTDKGLVVANLDGSDPKHIESKVNKFIVVDDSIYYSKQHGQKSGIYIMNTDGSEKERLLKDDYYSELSYYKGKLYYITLKEETGVNEKIGSVKEEKVKNFYINSYDLVTKEEKEIGLFRQELELYEYNDIRAEYVIKDDKLYFTRWYDTKLAHNLIEYDLNTDTSKVLYTFDTGTNNIVNVIDKETFVVASPYGTKIIRDGENIFTFDGRPMNGAIFEEDDKMYLYNEGVFQLSVFDFNSLDSKKIE